MVRGNGKLLQTRCKSYTKVMPAFQEKNYSITKRDYQRRRRQERRDFLTAYKLEKGCCVCGFNKHPAALQLDHIDPSTKVDNVGTMVQRAAKWEDIHTEIEKCRVICANCHAVHSYEHHTSRVGELGTSGSSDTH